MTSLQVETKIEYYERLAKDLNDLANKRASDPAKKDQLQGQTELHDSQIDFLESELVTLRRYHHHLPAKIHHSNHRDMIYRDMSLLESQQEKSAEMISVLEVQLVEERDRLKATREEVTSHISRTSLTLAETRDAIADLRTPRRMREAD